VTYRLALNLGSERVGAAVVEDGNVSWFDLGQGGEGTLAAVHLGDDGTAVVGDDALAAAGRPGRFDPDPVGSLAIDDGAVETVAALLAAVVDEVTTARGEPPQLVMLAHPDDWPAARTRALADAARRAGIGSFERVSAGAAADAYRKVSGDEGGSSRSVGYGAAILAAGAVSLDATQATPAAGASAIITLEDIAGPLPDASPPEPPIYETEGSSSVFDEAPPPASPPTQALPVVPPPPPPLPPASPGGSEPPDDADGGRWARWAVVLGVVAAVLLLALILVLVNDDGGGDQVATDGSTTTVADSTSSVADSSSSTTSSTTSTTTTSTTTTSTTTTSSTTSTTTTSTTTTMPAPVDVLIEPGELIVDPTGAANSVQIGSDGTVAVSTLILARGDADDDTGFLPVDNCTTAQVRRVRWGGLELVLLDDAEQTFGQWVVDGRFDGAEVYRTSAGVGVGTTVDELLAAYDDVTLDPAGGGLEQWIFVVDEPGGTIIGITSGGDGDDVIESLWSGDGCNNLFAL